MCVKMGGLADVGKPRTEKRELHLPQVIIIIKPQALCVSWFQRSSIVSLNLRIYPHEHDLYQDEDFSTVSEIISVDSNLFITLIT